jgi:hypothetical protein
MCDEGGNQHLLLNYIVDHKKEGNAVPKEDAFVWNHGRKYPKKTTKDWKLCVEWKDGITSWVPLSTLKESNPVEIAEYAVAHELSDEPAFSWWVPFTLKKRDTIISAVSKRYWKRTKSMESEYQSLCLKPMRSTRRMETIVGHSQYRRK